MATLLDTHAWLWWVTEDRRLSKRAAVTIARSQRDDALWLSLISVWEVAKKIQKGQLGLDRPLDEWLDLATLHDGLRLAELTRPVLVESCRLPGTFHGDPADQMIVATARHLGTTLVTKDPRFETTPTCDLCGEAGRRSLSHAERGQGVGRRPCR